MESQLAVIIKDSGLETTKAKYILDNFQDYFEIASEWEKKAKQIVVTSAFQTKDMEMAREGRLFLREKRIAIENSRKKLKEESLREGKAIDGIANVLKALIVPIEEYLDKQERFVAIELEKKESEMRLQIERRIEAERLAKEKEDAEALEKARAENQRLRAEAVEKERIAKIEMDKKNAELEKERQLAAKAEESRNAERDKALKAKRAAEEKARAEIEEVEAKKKRAAELARKKLDDERREKERLEEILRQQVECPFCHKRFNPKARG